MIGECTGKVRSTPTPKLTLRTVNVSRTPTAGAADHDALEDLDPGAGALDDLDVDLERVAGAERRDVVAQAEPGRGRPACAWWCRSPAGATGHPRRSWVGGGRRTRCGAPPPWQGRGHVARRPPVAERGRPAARRLSLPQRAAAPKSAVRRTVQPARRGPPGRAGRSVGRGRARRPGRAGAARSAAAARPAASGATWPWWPDIRTAGTSRPRQRGRLGVDGVLQQAVLVALLDQALGVADHAGQQPGDRLDDGEHGDLAAVQHVVAQADRHARGAAARRRPAPARRCPRSARRRRPARARRPARGPAPG